ncbi:helix-turn-helix domain-containing protein [Cytobacillus oceanisediminis]|nr:XRE family transcriptional regulator [Cytobacillus oceanisediminis]
MQQIKIRVKLDKVLKDRGNMTQLDLVNKLNAAREQRGEQKKVRPAAISEFYNNQRKTLNKELIEEIATVLEITDINELIEFYNY